MISKEHRRKYLAYYKKHGKFPSRPSPWVPTIEKIAVELGASTVIDYGCGPSHGVSKHSWLQVSDYDPGLIGFDVVPPAADLVVSIHALEHVEDEEQLARVIEHTKTLARLAVLLVVSCQASSKSLPDGTSWHTIVRSEEWWRERLAEFEPMPTLKPSGKEFAGLWKR